MPIGDTSKRDPFIHMMGAMSDGSSGYVEGMERAGQRQLVDSTDLPTRGPDAELLALGFTLGEPYPHDRLFRPATLPEGWRCVGSDHPMWSHIVDEKDRQRVSIFYKAAFYDRDAFMNVVAPTSRLDDLYYADEEPTRLALDDLLTEERAREWVARRRAHDVKYRDLASQKELDGSRYVKGLARLDRIEALLPEGGA